MWKYSKSDRAFSGFMMSPKCQKGLSGAAHLGRQTIGATILFGHVGVGTTDAPECSKRSIELHERTGKSGCVTSRKNGKTTSNYRRRTYERSERTALRYHVSPKGLISTLNDHAERGWLATCQASSAIATGVMKKSSGLSLKRSRVQGTSITASMTM